MDLAALLTEQANPASAHIDKLSTAEMLSVMNDEDRKVAESVKLEIPHIAQAVDGIVEAFRKGGRLFYIGAGTSGRLGVLDAAECPPTFNVSADLVQGIIAGGEAALSRATETTEDDPAIGVRDLTARGLSEERCAVRDRGERANALRARGNRRGESGGRADDRHQLHAGFGTGAAGEDRDHSSAGAGDYRGIDQIESGHRDQACPQHAHDRRVSSAWDMCGAT